MGESQKNIYSKIQDKKSCSIYFFKCVVIFLMLSPIYQSCSVAKFLDPEKGETLLVANKIEFDKAGNYKVKNKALLTEQLTQRFQQRPNRKLFGIRRPYFYYMSLDSVDKANIGLVSDRTMRRILGEEPVFVDTSKAQKTTELMTTFLENKGYVNAEVDYSYKTNKQKTKGEVSYHIKTKGLYTIDTIVYQCKDSIVQHILDSLAEKSFLSPGNPIDIELYEKEVSRITTYMINNGYTNFYPQYINNLDSPDSSNTELTAKLIFEVLVPPGEETHQVFYIGDIHVYPDFIIGSGNQLEYDTIINGIHFATGGQPFKVKPKSLTNSIAIKSGELYRFEDVESTRRQLGALGVFSTPVIKIEPDSIFPDRLNFYIQLTSNKKWEMQHSGDISYTIRNGPLLSTNLIGIAYSPSIRNRNLFKGAELGVFGFDLGVELATFGSGAILNSMDARGRTDIFFPRFVEYPKVWKGLTNTGLVSKPFYDKVKKNGISRVSTSYNLLSLFNNYQLHFFDLSFGHDIQLSSAKRLSANQAGIDLLIPKIIPGSPFDTLMQNQPFLGRSFSRQFMTGFLFKDISFTYDESFLGYNSYWYFRSYFDVSGLEVMGLNALFNTISGNNSDWSIGGVNLSHYLKLELDGRRYWRVGQHRTLVGRLNIGVVRPFYNSSDVPYVIQFFVGGPYSLRGWYARGLGPGSFIDSLNLDLSNRNQFYQAADMKIEMNLEYRFFLTRPFGFFNLHWAFFLDGGNIWTLKNDPDRPASQFSFTTQRDNEGNLIKNNFLNAMAVSGGMGARIDISYVTLRVDVGTPLRNAYPDASRNNTYWSDFSGWGLRDIVWSFALGYPF